MTQINQNQTNKDVTDQSFETFFHGWLIRQENYLQQLLQMDQIRSLVPNHNSQEIDEPKCKKLTSRVMAHYGEYYETKSRIACDNVFLLFSPTRLSSLELSFLWVAGFKASLVFWLVTDSVLDLTKEQARRMQVIVVETKGKEKELAKELARIQEDVVGGFGPDQGASTENASDCSGDKWERKRIGQKLARIQEDVVGVFGPDQGASTENASDCSGDKGERKRIGQKLARIQEDLAATPMMALARRVGTGEKDRQWRG